MRISLAQLNLVPGAFEENTRKIRDAYRRACSEQARLLLTSEMAVCGYPLYDWIQRPETLEKSEKAFQELLEMTKNQTTALLLGHIFSSPPNSGKLFQNGVSVLENGVLVFRQAKTLLPSYDVFDEARYFEPSNEIQLWNCDGVKVAIAICEDLWSKRRDDGTFGLEVSAYRRDPVDDYEKLGAEVVLSLSSSPYQIGKALNREKIHREIAQRLKAPLIYVNQVGATDEILFDGGSFALNSSGEFLGKLPHFEESFGTVVIGDKASQKNSLNGTLEPAEEFDILEKAIICGIREYFQRTGFKKAILGLSGGIDSALVASLACFALGPENVLGVAMPSQYSSGHSLEDAQILAKNLGIRFEVKPIKFVFSTFSRELAEGRGTLKSVALENLQSRLRGTVLMTLSNHDSSLVLTTGNKSELAMGYCTLYGDMNGALCPLGDLYKTQVYTLSKKLNSNRGNPIPERTLTKAPSAELRPNQADQDSLPSYDLLDKFLFGYLEENRSIEALEEQFKSSLPTHGSGSVQDLVNRLVLNEYKRKQSPPILKVSSKSFGIGRRVPLTKKF